MQEVFEKIIEKLEEKEKYIKELLQEVCFDVRSKHGDDCVCGLCEYDGAYIGESWDWYNECPGFDSDECFKLSTEMNTKLNITEIVKQAAIEYNNGWIPVESGKLPENEKKVEITFIRKHYKTGETLYLTARAFYEDGTLTTEDSAYGWGETDNWEYCEEKDACIIPEGWYEGVSFAEVFGIVDMPVIAWRYLTEPYQQKGE